MARLAFRILASIIVALSCGRSASAQTATPAALVDAFAKAWNTHDMKAFDRLFTERAIWVPVAEVRTEGRDKIVADFSEIHSTWAKETTVVPTAVKVQILRSDVAVVLFHAAYLGADGKTIPGVDRALLIVAVRQEKGWRIAAGQLTKQSPPA